MKVYNFDDYSSLVNQYLSEMRNISVQTDRLRFRRNLERLGEILLFSPPYSVPEFHFIRVSFSISTMPRMRLYRHTANIRRKRISISA